MKKGTPLTRKTPLPRSTKPLTQRKPLKRSSALNKTQPANTNREHKLKRTTPTRAKRPTVTAAERHTRALVTTRSQGLCERCGQAPATDKAHRIGRAVGGKWTPENILDLCHPCHMHDHANPEKAYQSGWHLRSHHDPAQEPVRFCHDGSTGWAFLREDGTYEWCQSDVV